MRRRTAGAAAGAAGERPHERPVPPLGAATTCAGRRRAVVIVYADFTCPRCAVAAERCAACRAPVFRHFALRARHPRAVPLARRGGRRARRTRSGSFTTPLYADQGRIDDPHLWERAERLGLDVERLEADRRDPGGRRACRSATSRERCAPAPRPRRARSSTGLHDGAPARLLRLPGRAGRRRRR